MNRFLNFVMLLVFGKESLEGIYESETKEKIKKTYRYSSVFPNEESLEKFLSQQLDETQ